MVCVGSVGVRRTDGVQNERIQMRYWKEVSVGDRIDQDMLRWFGCVYRMKEENLTWKMYMNTSRARRRGKLKRGWIDCVNNIFYTGSQDIQRARVST